MSRAEPCLGLKAQADILGGFAIGRPRRTSPVSQYDSAAERPKNSAWDFSPRRRLVLLLSSILLVIPGCAGTREQGTWHTVERGQTLWRIAHNYGVDLQELAEVNDIEDPTLIRAGQKIFIPGAEKPLEIEPYRPPRQGAPEAAKPVPRVKTHKGRLAWPVKGVVTSRYGIRGGRRHDGIDIGAPTGTSIKAAETGAVAYAEYTRGYGNLVILRHDEHLMTVYAHCKKILVSKGDQVRQGQAIATVGATGRASGPHLHFEVRVDRKARNPMFYLP